MHRLVAIALAALAVGAVPFLEDDDSPVTRVYAFTPGSALPGLTISRATTMTCQSGGHNGTIATVAANTACVNENGIQIYGAATNNVVRGDELDNVAWTVLSGMPTITANAGADLDDDGVNEADDVEDDDALAAECICDAAGCGTATGTYTLSAYVKSVTGATNATLRIATDGIGSGECEFTDLSTTAYKRKFCTKAITGTPTTVDACLCPGRRGTVADTAKVRWAHVQCEVSNQMSPVIFTAGAATTRNDTNVNFASANLTFNSGGQICGTVVFPSEWLTFGSPRIFDLKGPNTPLYFSGPTTISMFDGANQANATITAPAGRTATLCGSWGGRLGAKEVGGNIGSAAYDGTILGTLIHIASFDGNQDFIRAGVTRFCISRRPHGCEP